MTTPLTPITQTSGDLDMRTLVRGDKLIFDDGTERQTCTVVNVPYHTRHIDVDCNGVETFLLVTDFESGFVTRSYN